MAGYAAITRLRGGSTRLLIALGSARSGTIDADPAGSATAEESTARPGRDWVELVGRPIGERLAARWADLRETWSQTTFYLFDPESWR
jgi:hypothetical protein